MLKVNQQQKREGMILLIVVAFLAMFMVMGLTYLLHADAQLRNSIDELLALDMKEDPSKVIDLNPSMILDFFLEKFLYDQADGTTGANAIRGHSLARSIYGGYTPGQLNDKAFTGVGKLNRDIGQVGNSLKEWQFVNFSIPLGGGFVPDPEKINIDPATKLPIPGTVKTSAWNVPYTYPDQNNFFLGWLKSDGTQVIPSFHRDGIFGKMDISGFPNNSNPNPNWTNAVGRFMTPRPRPIDHAQDANGNFLFPYPEPDGMDVKNLEGYPGGNDSIWVDVGSPVFTALDGRKYKILVAPLILDLDGKINLNAAGNVAGSGFSHVSNQGWGPWEINIASILNSAQAVQEAQQVKLGFGAPTLLLPGTYGTSMKPGGSVPGVPKTVSAKTYSKVDYNSLPDAANVGLNQGPLQPPQNNSTSHFPAYSSNFNADVLNREISSDAGNGIYHPSLANPSLAKTGNSIFTPNELSSILRWNAQGSSPKATNLGNLLSSSLNINQIYDNSTIKTRNMITSLSTDLQKPAILPFFYTVKNGGNPTQLDVNYALFPQPDFSIMGSPKMPYPTSSAIQYPEPGMIDVEPGTNSDFPLDAANKISGVSSITGYKSKLNLNRKLADYPGVNWGFKAESEITFNNMGPIPQTSGGRYLGSPDLAIRDRLNFAREIFNTLVLSTGVRDMSLPSFLVPNVPDGNFESNRYLAQLAANMVDYIDKDDVSTVFTWKYDPTKTVNNVFGVNYFPKLEDPGIWVDASNNPLLDMNGNLVPRDATNDQRVYGVELPKVVVNEVYSEIRNDPSDPFPDINNKKPASKPYQVNFWLELLNPLTGAESPNANTIVGGNLPADANGALLEQDPYYQDQTTVVRVPVYKIDILDLKDTGLLTYNNMKGDISNNIKISTKTFKPDASMDSTTPFYNKGMAVGSFLDLELYEKKTSRLLFPSGSNYLGFEPNSTTDGQNGFLTLGPVDEFPSKDPATSSPPANYNSKNFTFISNIRVPELRYTIPQASPNYDDAKITNTLASLKHTVVLRRLADPYRLPQENPAQPNFNPYVTVDYLEDVPLNDAVTNASDDKRTTAVPNTVTNVVQRKSYGKVQPYLSYQQTVAASVGLTDQPQHTMMRHNGSDINAASNLNGMLDLPFRWMIHLDRGLKNELDLLNLPACKPQELTQRFSNPAYMDSNKKVMGSLAPWNDEKSNLYRFFELAGVESFQKHSSFGGRQIGRVNINNVWDKEIFTALADPNPNNNFTQQNVSDIFDELIKTRSPSGFPNLGDQPIWGFGIGQASAVPTDVLSPNQRGIKNSFLMPDSTGSKQLFDVGNANLNPYDPIAKELLSKIFNNVTTRSNVFAIWLTTGFFEVIDDTANPPKLGAEIGKINGKNIRHRMFAIVDRTNMVEYKNEFAFSIQTAPVSNISFGAPGALKLINPANSAQIGLADGMTLSVDPYGDEEVVTLRLNPLNGELVADFNKVHLPGTSGKIPFILRGNPGPWAGYDRTKDKDVVIYSEIIE